MQRTDLNDRQLTIYRLFSSASSPPKARNVDK